jgi:hypothetical protein
MVPSVMAVMYNAAGLGTFNHAGARVMRVLAVAGLALLALAPAARAASQLKPEEVPEFRLQARVLAIGGQAPEGKKFSFGLAGVNGTAAGSQWSTQLGFGRPQAEATLKGYPAMYLPGWPIVLRLTVQGVVDPTLVEAELTFAEKAGTVKLCGELFGPSLGILVWRDEQRLPQAATMAQYNRRYWKALEGVDIPANMRPRYFPITDRFIGGDDDRRAWQEGIEQLRRAGFSAVMLPPSRPVREMLVKAGGRRTAWAVYSPPGYAFDFDVKVTPEAIAQWARQEARPYLEAGYARQDMAVFAMSDEPGWYYPSSFKALQDNAAAMARFRRYLQDQQLGPAELGAGRWEEVGPIGRSRARDLPSRRLFYWTMRFFAHDSARHFAACTRALEAEFYPGLPIFTNWNFFSGRFYVPGPVANNADKQSPDAAMGGHDWLEFGRLRGGTMLWTEDWFADGRAYQWSFYAAKLRSAAVKDGVEFGGYVIPRTAGDRKQGILQKVLSIVGHGGKAIEYFVFGPEYNFPGNCYSERAAVLPQMAEAHRMIGAAEDVLWPGRPPRSPVAILAPRSAEVWDAREIALPNQIQDATNNDLNRATVDYMAEVFDLYLALQHANIPVEFVDEDDLSLAGLKPYSVLYVTEPNIPAEGQQGIVDWVRAGGTLATVSGAGQRDRYDEPCAVLRDATGIQEEPRPQLLVADARALKEVAKGTGKGPMKAIGVRGVVTAPAGSVAATFDDGSPAVVSQKVGRGRAVHFACMPGLSYWKSASEVKDGLPAGFSDSLREWITWPVRLADVPLPVAVNRPLVEAPLLASPQGIAVTLLGWTGEPLAEVQVDVRTDRKIGRVESVRRGPQTFQAVKGGIRFVLPLDGADIVTLR